METKAALEETIKLHREGVQKARHIETEIKVCNMFTGLFIYLELHSRML